MSKLRSRKPDRKGRPGGRAERGRRERPLRAGEERVVLYRCPTPTNFLCPCGAAERRLRKLGVHHRIERVPYAKGKRPEIEELTKQRRVPVLVYGEEIVTDSKRILQYLEHRHPEPERPAKPPKSKRRKRGRGKQRTGDEPTPG